MELAKASTVQPMFRVLVESEVLLAIALPLTFDRSRGFPASAMADTRWGLVFRSERCAHEWGGKRICDDAEKELLRGAGEDGGVAAETDVVDGVLESFEDGGGKVVGTEAGGVDGEGGEVVGAKAGFLFVAGVGGD
jgi:hypothetical protein